MMVAWTFMSAPMRSRHVELFSFICSRALLGWEDVLERGVEKELAGRPECLVTLVGLLLVARDQLNSAFFVPEGVEGGFRGESWRTGGLGGRWDEARNAGWRWAVNQGDD
ncbi:hypothetical protein F5887DRAFT_917868 [Amanita rubescens]|nr:hypothetical protein F5887DRAFT_917868 [Amanita rubescens]